MPELSLNNASLIGPQTLSGRRGSLFYLAFKEIMRNVKSETTLYPCTYTSTRVESIESANQMQQGQTTLNRAGCNSPEREPQPPCVGNRFQVTTCHMPIQEHSNGQGSFEKGPAALAYSTNFRAQCKCRLAHLAKPATKCLSFREPELHTNTMAYLHLDLERRLTSEGLLCWWS